MQRLPRGRGEPNFIVENKIPDAVFCDALATINTRPQPSDDYEQVVVAQQYLLAIEAVFPSELADNLAIALEWIDSIVTDGEFTESSISPDGLEVAIREINEFVDEKCLGR